MTYLGRGQRTTELDKLRNVEANSVVLGLGVDDVRAAIEVDGPVEVVRRSASCPPIYASTRGRLLVPGARPLLH